MIHLHNVFFVIFMISAWGLIVVDTCYMGKRYTIRCILRIMILISSVGFLSTEVIKFQKDRIEKTKVSLEEKIKSETPAMIAE